MTSTRDLMKQIAAATQELVDRADKALAEAARLRYEVVSLQDINANLKEHVQHNVEQLAGQRRFVDRHTCKNCRRGMDEHTGDAQCLFEASTFTAVVDDDIPF